MPLLQNNIAGFRRGIKNGNNCLRLGNPGLLTEHIAREIYPFVAGTGDKRPGRETFSKLKRKFPSASNVVLMDKLGWNSRVKASNSMVTLPVTGSPVVPLTTRPLTEAVGKGAFNGARLYTAANTLVTSSSLSGSDVSGPNGASPQMAIQDRFPHEGNIRRRQIIGGADGHRGVHGLSRQTRHRLDPLLHDRRHNGSGK